MWHPRDSGGDVCWRIVVASSARWSRGDTLRFTRGGIRSFALELVAHATVSFYPIVSKPCWQYLCVSEAFAWTADI